MKRSLQEIVELIIFGLLALLIGTGLLWVFGQILKFVGWLFIKISWILWLLLKYILPIAIAAGIIFFIVRYFVGRSQKKPEATATDTAAPLVETNEPAAEIANATENLSETVETEKEATAEKIDDVKEVITEKVEETKEVIAEKIEDVKETTADKLEETQEAEVEKTEEAKETSKKTTKKSTKKTTKKDTTEPSNEDNQES